MAQSQQALISRLLEYGLEIAGLGVPHQRRLCEATRLRLFKDNFGVGPKALANAFRDLATTAIPAARIENPNMYWLLVSMYWLKAYQTEGQNYTKFGRDKETMRDQIRKYVNALAALKELKIVWKDLNEIDEAFVLSVDGVHFRIKEPRKHPSANWCSHKSNSAGLAYEIGMSIWRNQVVWVKGPFQPATHDKTKYQEQGGLQEKIPFGKLVVADRGYRGEDIEEGGQFRTLSIRNTCDSKELKEFKRRVRARHEIFNGRLKNFAILNERFRHRVSKRNGPKDVLAAHKAAFEAVCVICQYDMENGNPLLDA